MKTNNNISDRRGKASISSLNRMKKVVKWGALLITSIIGLVLWVFLRPIFLSLSIKHRMVIVAPMIEKIDLSKYLNPELVEEVSVGGESGKYARPLDFNWVIDMQRQCREAGVPFNFHQTGSYLINDGRQYHIPREHQHSQAKKSRIGF